MKTENQHFVQIIHSVFTSAHLSKGAKLLFGALHAQEAHVVDERQQELPLGLPPLPVKVVGYEPVEIAAYMQCGVATVRRYVKELQAAGWISFHEGKSRGRNRRLVLQLETPLVVDTLLFPSEKKACSRVKEGREKRLKPAQLEAFDIPTLLQETAEPKDREQLYLEMKVATAKVTKRVFAKGMMPIEYIFAPLTLEDLQILWSSWDAHNPTLPEAGIDQHLQTHLDAVKKSQEPYCDMRVGKMYHLYTGALCLHREIESPVQV